MITQQYKDVLSLRVILVAVVLFTITSCQRATVPHGGFFSGVTSFEKIETYNVWVTVIDVTTGKPFIGANIVTKQGRSFQVAQAKDGILTFKIPDNKTTWFRTVYIGFYHNEFRIKPNSKYVTEVISYQVPDYTPLH